MKPLKNCFLQRLRASFGFELAIALLSWAALCLPSPLHAGSALPYELEAAYIYQFTNYIEWPNAKTTTTAPFVICIIGESPLTRALEKLASAKTIHGRKIQIRAKDSEETLTDSLAQSQIVVLTTSDPAVRDAVLKETQHKGALTISHHPQASEHGVMINFYVEDGKLRYEINRKLVEKENFQISSQLLKLARIVESKSAK